MVTDSIVQPNDRILRMPELVKTVGLSRPQIYLLISQNKFPKQFKLTPGGKVAGWLQSEVMEYIRSRVIESRNLAALEVRNMGNTKGIKKGTLPGALTNTNYCKNCPVQRRQYVRN